MPPTCGVCGLPLLSLDEQKSPTPPACTSACLKMLHAKQGSHWFHFKVFGMTQPKLESKTPDLKAAALIIELT